MNSILQRIIAEQAAKQPLMLVTVITDQGSSPRGAGAMMLQSPAGRLLGSIGGGAVEYHGMQQAEQWLAERHGGQRSFALHPSKQDDIGMICGGAVTVQFCYIDPADTTWTKLAELALAQLEGGRACWLRHSDTQAPALFSAEGQPLFNAESAITLPEGGKSCYMGEGYLSCFAPGERVVIFGGGHISQALVPLLSQLGFCCTVYEDRRDYLSAELFPTADQLILAPYEQLAQQLAWGAEDYFIVMTYGHAADYQVQEQLMRGDYAYLGVIGSRAKTAVMNEKLLAAGITAEQLSEVHTPIGVSIGAVTPEEIAVSIAAELIQVRAGRRKSGKAAACPMK